MRPVGGGGGGAFEDPSPAATSMFMRRLLLRVTMVGTAVCGSVSASGAFGTGPGASGTGAGSGQKLCLAVKRLQNTVNRHRLRRFGTIGGWIGTSLRDKEIENHTSRC